MLAYAITLALCHPSPRVHARVRQLPRDPCQIEPRARGGIIDNGLCGAAIELNFAGATIGGIAATKAKPAVSPRYADCSTRPEGKRKRNSDGVRLRPRLVPAMSTGGCLVPWCSPRGMRAGRSLAIERQPRHEQRVASQGEDDERCNHDADALISKCEECR
jgi:hypothetical protein